MRLEAPAAAQQEIPGLAVDEQAPQFTLPDQGGTEVSLKKLLQNKNVALVFYRSAAW